MSVLHQVAQRFHAMEISPKVEAALLQCPQYQVANLDIAKTQTIANHIVVLSFASFNDLPKNTDVIERHLLISSVYDCFTQLINQYFEHNHLSQCEYLLIAYARRLAQHEATQSISPEMQQYSQQLLKLAKQWDKALKKQRQQWLKMVG